MLLGWFGIVIAQGIKLGGCFEEGSQWKDKLERGNEKKRKYENGLQLFSVEIFKEVIS